MNRTYEVRIDGHEPMTEIGSFSQGPFDIAFRVGAKLLPDHQVIPGGTLVYNGSAYKIIRFEAHNHSTGYAKNIFVQEF
jgi:hypothetical protein